MNRDQIMADVLDLMNSVVRDWEFEGTVGANTRLFADLNFESLDLVVLGVKVQERFGQTFPFPEFFAGFLRDRSYPSLRIDLPPNDTVVLRVRDAAIYDSWWSVHELRLWRR